VDAVTTSGGAATPLQVSRHVWHRHRPELEESGDLLYVWQLELRAAADAMVASGVLSTSGDAWVVADHAAARALAVAPSGWSADDVAVAVEAYVGMLRDREAGRPLGRAEAVAHVRDRTGRTAAAVEALFSNVSAVVQEHGVEPVPAYPPRSNVPRGVRQAVAGALSG
jgi:hypothetical protein